MLPFTPDDSRALISDPTSSLCGNFVKTLLRLPTLFDQLVRWLVDDAGEGIRTLEAGQMVEFFYDASNDHRKLCNGQALSTTDYAVLYAKIGNVFDTMDGQSAPGAGFFRVPKVGGRFPLAVGSIAPSGTVVGVGSVGGEEKHVLTAAELPPHSHEISALKHNDTTHDAGPAMPNADFEGDDAPIVSTDVDGGDGEGHSTIPPYFGVYVLIVTGI